MAATQRTDRATDAAPASAAAAPPLAAVLAHAHSAWRTGDRAGAMALLSDYVARDPSAAAAWSRLGAYALESGDHEAARASLDAAVALAPEDAAAWTNLGTALLRLGRIHDAIAAYRKTLALEPQAIGARINLGNALQRAGDLDEAVAVLEHACRVDPDSAEAHNNLGNLYKEQGRFEDALAAYEAAYNASPAFRPAFSNLLALTKLSPRHSPEEIFTLHRAFAERFEPQWQAGYLPPENDPDPQRKLRIGYVSPDCHTALPAFVEPVLRQHDRERFEIFAYFNNPQPAATLARLGPITARVMKGAADRDVAHWIRNDAVDVLIDIAGHTGHNRLGVFGAKPAPVQITWLDYLNTTGLEAIDCRLTDVVSDPPGDADTLHSEALVRLSPTQWCWNPPGRDAAFAPLPAASAGYLTLGSFNNASKLTDATLALWARLLGAVPDAHLVVVGVPEGLARTRIVEALAGAGERVHVLGRLSADVFRRTVASVDIALDPVPFSGATTTLEALWQGVPVVTRPGATSASRSTASLLTALDLIDWIAGDDDEYIAIVANAVRPLDGLARLRRELPQRLEQSAICDAAGFTRQLETVFRDLWCAWCERRAGAAPTLRSGGDGLPKKTAIDRVRLDAALAQIETAVRSGRGADVVSQACALIDETPHWQAAQRAYLQTLLAWAGTQERLVERTFPKPEARTRLPTISFVICSIDAARFRSVTANVVARFSRYPLDIVGVHDARSLAEGYNRGALRAKGDLLVFCHDDIELVTDDFAPRLVSHLAHHDGVGVAGASRVVGPRWGDAGQRWIHGHVLHAPPPGRPGILLMAAGFQAPVCEGVSVLDGALIAVRRHVWEATRFDAERYDGFHLYDLDFTWRASRAGARLVVPADITIYHASQGRYGDAWRRYARRFVEQARLDPLAPSRPDGLQARLDTPAQVDTLRAAMLHFRYGAPVAQR
jgi:protein O-GlcNAc transferase